MADEAEAAREHLLEELSHYDDGLVEMILEEQEIPKDRLVAAVRKATLEIKMTWSCAAPRSRTRACSRCWTR